MTRKLIKQLVESSLTNDELDPKKVERIAEVLKRKELKQYIKALKDYQDRRSVTVEIPYKQDEKYKETLVKAFKDKKIRFQVNPSLLLGMRIRDYDTIYEMDLKNALENLREHLIESYE